MDFSRRKFLGAGATAAASLLTNILAIRNQTSDEIREVKPGSDGSLIRKDEYSLDDAITYLNHASIGTVPRVVQRSHQRYLDLCETNPWLYMWSDPWRQPLEDLHGQVASLLGCLSDEVAITHNTTELFNTLAHGLPLEKGDEVLFSTLNHGGASICWEYRSREKHFNVRRFEFPVADVPTMSVSDVVAVHEAAISPNTKVLVLPHIDNMVGLRHPLKEIATMAHEKGVRWVAVDGAQTANMIPLNMRESGVDFYATSAHKWTQSPKGLGMAYVSKKVQQDLQPMWVTWGQKSWAGTARIFEDYGTRALPAMMALGDALAFQEAVEMDERIGHHRRLRQAMQEVVQQTSGIEWASPVEWKLGGALYAINISGGPSTEVAGKLFEDHGIVLRPFRTDSLNALRVSPNLNNTEADLHKLVGAVAKTR